MLGAVADMTKTHHILLVAVIGVVSLIAFTYQVGQTEVVFNANTPKHQPLSLESIAKKMSFKNATALFDIKSVSIKLPTWLPEGLKPTTAYCLSNVAVFVYSSKGVESIGSAEFTLQITFSDTLPFDPKTSKGTFMKVGEYDVYYDMAAAEGSNEYRSIYGPTCKLLVLHAGNVNYWLKGNPTFSFDDMVRIATSLS